MARDVVPFSCSSSSLRPTLLKAKRSRVFLTPRLCAFAQAQDVAVLTYNNEGVVCQRPEDPWVIIQEM